jgi:hypothetical protein
LKHFVEKLARGLIRVLSDRRAAGESEAAAEVEVDAVEFDPDDIPPFEDPDEIPF